MMAANPYHQDTIFKLGRTTRGSISRQCTRKLDRDNPMASEQFHARRVPGALRGPRMAPRRRVVFAYGINLDQGNVSVGEGWIESNGLEQQGHALGLPPLHAVELRQMVVGLRI